MLNAHRMNDCDSSMQGSTASSSSDVVTLTTASSWCAIPPGARIRVVRLVRPHTRRILVTPDTNPSFGFAVRGGKEFGTGFFVSTVERNSEADSKGLKIGDQILRINGFRVDDAVHKEFIQFVSSQDRITLKVRGVGMLPIKDKVQDRLSWSVVKTPSVSNTPSESSFNTASEHDMRNGKDINVVLNVAPRTKLGLGICKGPEWKPGIFVQFTKEKSVAREAGLRPGDQILSVNSIDFSDVLFSEAVAVMKSSNKLDMMVRTAAGCDLFPGESSGYNSSASSVTGDQSPCWGDIKAKRLTAVREESSTASTAWQDMTNGATLKARGNLKNSQPSAQVLKEANKTIIKLSEHGTSINNTFVESSQTVRRSQPSTGIPPPPPPIDLHTNNGTLKATSSNNNDRRADTRPIYAHVQRNDGQLLRGNNTSKLQHVNSNAQYATTQPTTTAPMPPAPPKAPTNDANDRQTCSETTTTNSCVSNSTLSSAITEELKKRKEKLQQQRNKTTTTQTTHTNHSQCNANSNNNNNSNNKKFSHMHAVEQQHDDHYQQQQQLQQQPPSSPTTKATSATMCNNANSFTNTIMRRQQLLKSRSCSIVRTASSATNCSNERNTTTTVAAATNGNGIIGNPATMSVDHHSALMDEFKRAHQRMFKNGFNESERNKSQNVERQDALRHTAFMEDDVSHRASRLITNENFKAVNEQKVNGRQVEDKNGHDVHIPPPPPQFANTAPLTKTNQSPVKTITTPALQKQTTTTAAPVRQIRQPAPAATGTSATTTSTTAADKQKPPTSPVPDYEPPQMRTTMPNGHSQRESAYAANGAIHSNNNQQNGNSNTGNNNNNQNNPQRRTLRLGVLTIGEYDQLARKEPSKFEFLQTQKRHNLNNGNNHNNNSSANIAQNGNSLQAELQHTLQRSNLKKANGIAQMQQQQNQQQQHYRQQQQQQLQQQQQTQQHQHHCPLQNYEVFDYAVNVGNMTRKMQAATINGKAAHNGGSNTTTTATATSSSNGTSTGILKNSSNRHSSGYTKNHEKSISFGN